MPLQQKQSKYAGYDIRYLKGLLRDIDKYEDPEFYTEIHELIIAKEFQKLAIETKDPFHVAKTIGTKLPGEKNRGYRSGAGHFRK